MVHSVDSHHISIIITVILHLEPLIISKVDALPVKKHVNSPHPNIYVAIELLQKNQSLTSMTRLCDNPSIPAPKRRKNNMISEECSMKLWKRYDEGRIGMPTFLMAARIRYFQEPSKSSSFLLFIRIYLL